MLQKNSFKYILPFCFLVILLYTGCSNRYTEKDFDSRSDYYSKINSVFKSRTAEINLMNGDKIEGKNIHISGDSIYWEGNVIEPELSIPYELIKKAKYISYLSYNPVKFNAMIRLKNDSIIYLKNATVKDNKIFSEYEKILSKPVVDINSLSYCDHLVGACSYGMAGMFAGAVLGYKLGSDASVRERSPQLGIIAGSFFFTLCGVLTGAIFGNPESYIINNNQSETLKFLKNFGLMGGITSSSLYSGFSDNRQYNTTHKEQYTFGLFYLWDINNFLKIRPGINYCIKGGIYTYPNSNAIYGADANVYIKIIETPLLVQLKPFPESASYLNIIAGPSINIPIKGKLEEFYEGFQDFSIKNGDGQVNAKTYLSFIYGIGVKWDPHFSTELLFNKELSGFGTAQLPDGTILNLRQTNFQISTTFTL